MPEAFSLARRAWVPVVLFNGQRERVRLCDIASDINGHPISRVSTGRADCDVSLMEFLIGLLAVAMGPEDDREWCDRYRSHPDAATIEAAISPFADALKLDGDGPRFFQDYDDLGDDATPVEALFIDAPAEHFMVDNRTSSLCRSGAAIVLLTLQTMSPPGGRGHLTSLRGGGPLSTLVSPPDSLGAAVLTLWQRLWINVPSDFRSQPKDRSTIFPWFSPTRTTGKDKSLTTTPQDVHKAHAFFGMPRRIRLVFEPNMDHLPCDLTGEIDDVIVRSYVTRPWGTNYVGWSQGHPLSPYYRVKKGDAELLPVHLQSSRIGYRQWLGLVSGRDGSDRLAAAVVQEYRSRRARLITDVDFPATHLSASGYALDKMKPLDFGEASMPLLATGSPATDNDLDNHAATMISAAETVASQLVYSVRRAIYGEKSKTDRDTSVLIAVANRFWSETEPAFYASVMDVAGRVRSAGDDLDDKRMEITTATGTAWIDAMRRVALPIFDDTAPIDDAEGERIVDVIEGRKSLSMMFRGHNKSGRELYGVFALAPPDASNTKSTTGKAGSGIASPRRVKN